MFSTTDDGLPFGQPDIESQSHDFFRKSLKTKSWSDGECDIYEIKQRVKGAYRDFILNW